MENLELRFKHAPYFRCEKGHDWVPLCQHCETCVLAWKVFCTKEWFRRVNDTSQRRFLVSILGQLNNLYLLYYFQNILQPTQGKDFVYSRCRIDISKKEGKEEVVKYSLNQLLDKTVEQKMKEILYWFGNSTHRTKAQYTLLLLQMCDPKLLFIASEVIRVLFLREWSTISGRHEDSADILFLPEKNYDPVSDTSYISWEPKPKPISFPLSRPSGNKLGNKTKIEMKGKSSLQCISEMNKMLSGKAGNTKVASDPCNLLISMDEVRALSFGFSKRRDFIRHLPLHLSKHILRMLDKNSLNRCASVSQHWAILAQQVKTDMSMNAFIQNQISILQGSYTRGIDPNYASKVSIPVPKIADDGKRMRSKSQKWKLRTKNDYNLWAAYQSQETQQVQMEERNVFCGTYNIRFLSDTWDQTRVIHYNGGDLVAVSSNRKIHLLDISQGKELSTEFRGHAGSVKAVFLCEEENLLLSGSYDLSIRYWDLKSGVCIRIFYGHQGTITCMDLYKRRLVSGAKDAQVKEWDIDTGKCLRTFKHKDPILATKISDTYIVSSCERGLVKVWHIASAQLVKTLIGHEGSVKCVFFDQWHLVSGGVDGLVMAWSMIGKYERCLMAFKHPKEVLQVSLLYLRVISACGDGKIRIYNFLSGNCLKVIKVDAQGDPVQTFFYSANRMVVNTDCSIIMFQFENVKWQYSTDKSKAKKKDKEEEKEESSLGEAVSKSSTQAHSLRDSGSSKLTVTQDSLGTKPAKFRVPGKAPRGSLEGSESHRKPKSPRRDGKKKITQKDQEGMDDRQEHLEIKCDIEDEVKMPVKASSHPKKKSWKIPMSPDRFLLTVNTLQQTRNFEELAHPHRPHAQVIDAWGPSISYPRKVLTFKGKSIQEAADRLRMNNSPMDVTQISIPLEIQRLQPNLRNSLYGPSVQSTIPQPMLIRSRVPSSLRGEEHLTSSIHGAMHNLGPLTSMQVIKPNRMLAPRVGTATMSLKKEQPRFYTTLDPLRMNTEFMLLTVKEEKEYGEAKMKEYQASESTEVVDPDKASKAAWIRKIKGLPIDNFLKEGKIAAPELGPNVFI